MTTIIASPAGIDSAHWRKAARAATSARPVALPYILSVDRADYTKGILERIRAIRDLFRLQPELRRNLQFVFACQQTRKGLPAYDEYWRNCRSNFQDVILELATDDWAPIVWLTDAMTPDKLATWYAHAAAMLVNPSVDGLNLTAKEFVASSVNPESILILSKGAGVWYELRENIVTINDCQPDEITEAILRARQQSSACSRANLLALKQTVRANSLQRWWQNLVDYRNLDLSNISVRDSA
jgi:trehalose-6-phosphate synthase